LEQNAKANVSASVKEPTGYKHLSNVFLMKCNVMQGL